jgi:hypothetical protein
MKLKIWEFAIPAPRNVVVEAYFVQTYSSGGVLCKYYHFRGPDIPPDMLLICKMSRKVILSSYTTCIHNHCALAANERYSPTQYTIHLPFSIIDACSVPK